MRLIFLVLLTLTGCASTMLTLTRPAPPDADFGAVRTLSVEVHSKMDQAASNSVMTGLIRGEVPIPVKMDQAIKDSLTQALVNLGFAVCPAAPCGDGAMSALLTEANVNTHLTGGGLETHARVTARVKVRQNDGSEVYDYTFWAQRTGTPDRAGDLVRSCADAVAGRMRESLLPATERVRLYVEDGGELSPGVNALLAGSWRAAIDAFTSVIQQDPGNAAAWYDLGVAWEASGDWAQALAAYQSAAERKRDKTYLEAVRIARRHLEYAPPAAPQPEPAPAPQPPAPPPPPQP